MSIKIEDFGYTKDNKKVDLISLTNKNNLTATFINYGANWVNMFVFDKENKKQDIVLGYDDIKGYEYNAVHIGSPVGRCANRIDKGEFTLNGKLYKLELNAGNASLHSGNDYWNKRMYEYETFEEENSVEFTLKSPDKDQGFDGNATFKIKYTLDNNDTLTINYDFISDKDTLFSPTHHAYFNLDGISNDDIYEQEVFIDADSYTPMNDNFVVTGKIKNVDNTPMDFRKYKKIGKEINSDYDCLLIAGGYDHNYLLNNNEKYQKVASAYSNKTDVRVDVFTDMSGMQFYTGNFLDNMGKNGVHYKKRTGFCFETQFVPNAINIEGFKKPIVKANISFKTKSAYRFSLGKDI